MENNSKRSFDTILKVMRMVIKLQPAYLPVMLIDRLIGAVQPFINTILFAKIIDQLIGKASFEAIMKNVLLVVISDLVCSISYWSLNNLTAVYERVITERMYQSISDKTLCLDYEILEKKETLEMIQKAEEGMQSHGGIHTFCNGIGQVMQSFFTIIGGVIILTGIFKSQKLAQMSKLASFMDHWYSIVPLLIIAVFCFAANFLIQRWMGAQERKFFEFNVKLNRVYNYLSNFIYDYQQGKYIRLYRMQGMIMKEINDSTKKSKAKQYEMRLKTNKGWTMTYGIVSLLQWSSFIYVGLKAVVGLISVGNVTKYVQSFNQFYTGIEEVLRTIVDVEIVSRYLAYFSDFLEIKNEKYEGTIPVEKRDDNRYQIEFKDVSFHYPNNQEMVLSHINLKLNIGEKTAIVGKNGAGKTTFIKLLCRLYDPTEGEILLNGVNIKLYDYQEYLKLFSIVFQDFQLFSFSIAQNVAASTEFEETRVKGTLVKAGFGERLERMAEGIHTNIYQTQKNGVEISGGEAQKIAIARALYKDAPFVILDEPTSALDPMAEYDIYNRFNELVKDKTSIYISHRMSSCRFCNRIVVFEDGSITQVGCHEDLMKEDQGIYQQLWNAQAQYYQ